jgi:uncharacterized membrane protein
MNQHSICKPALRRNILAGLFPLFGSLFAAGGAVMAAPTAAPTALPAGPAALSGTPCACHGTVYSVINLDPEGGAAAFLNEKGQAAVGSFVFGTNSFFDGDRIRYLGSLGGEFTVIKGLNDRGVVAAESVDASEPFGNYYPVTWTTARGLRILPGSLGGQVWGINNRNQLIGQVPASGITARAVRFDPGGAVFPLGPLPFSLSEGRAISNSGFAGGYTDYADGTIHASVWNAAGALTDLGTLGGQRAFTVAVNERGEAAGYSDDPTNTNEIGFFWSPTGGRVPIGSQNGGSRLIAGLNDRGEVVGITGAPAVTTAYYWSRGRGLVSLPRAGASESDVFDINNRSEMVGGLFRAGSWRATLWRGLTTPIDLNSRLHRIPAGLVLERGAAINESGTILAYSNAGLVMLRPGTRGTDAPVLGPVTGLPDMVTVGDAVSASLGFIDNAPGQVHTAAVDWGDSCVSPLPLVSEASGTGNVGFQHTFCAPGLQDVTVRVTDSGGRSTETRRQVLVNAPAVAAVSGRGKLAGAAASGTAGTAGALPLQFALWAPLGNGRAAAGVQAGKAVVALHGPFSFRSDSAAVVAKNGAQVRLEGTGRYNGRTGYRFVVDALDAGVAKGGADRMRVRISHRDAAGADVVDYDSAGRAKAGVASVAGAGDGMAQVDGALTLGN